jgi:hypothetical protein
MPFVNTDLTPLLTGSGFTLWLYRTADTRATALAAGYFAAAGPRLETGDLILLQASDAVALLPVRTGDIVAAGLTVDTTAAPFRVDRTAARRFSIRQAASAAAITVILAPIAAGIASNGTVAAQANVTGPVTQVVFTLRDAGGNPVRGPTTANVSSGAASVTFPAPPVGSGYRMRVEATIDPAAVDTSQAFSVTAPFALLLPASGSLLLENSGRIVL